MLAALFRVAAMEKFRLVEMDNSLEGLFFAALAGLAVPLVRLAVPPPEKYRKRWLCRG